MTDARLRELYAGVLARDAGGRERCMSPEEILALVRREGDEEHRLEVLDHVMSCEACRRDFELLRSIERAGTEMGATAAATAPAARGSWSRFAPLALAASVLLAIAIGVAVQRGVRTGADVPRGEPDAVVLLAPPADVAAGSSIAFAWHPVPGAYRYVLEVLDAGGAVVRADTTADTTVTVRELRAPAPADYRWWVRATTAGGVQRASPMRPLRLRTR